MSFTKTNEEKCLKYLKKGFLRGLIVFVIMTAISLIMKSQGQDMTQVKSTFFGGLIGTIIAASSVIYDVKEWPIFKQTIIHSILMLFTILPVLILSGWFKLDTFIDYIKLFGIYIIWGLVLWTISYFVFGKLLNKEKKSI